MVTVDEVLGRMPATDLEATKAAIRTRMSDALDHRSPVQAVRPLDPNGAGKQRRGCVAT